MLFRWPLISFMDQKGQGYSGCVLVFLLTPFNMVGFKKGNGVLAPKMWQLLWVWLWLLGWLCKKFLKELRLFESKLFDKSFGLEFIIFIQKQCAMGILRRHFLIRLMSVFLTVMARHCSWP